jgi:cytidylate kinase
MKNVAGLERCFAYIHCQLKPAEPGARTSGATWRAPSVTLSRQTGAGGHVVAEKLAAYLQARSAPNAVPWTVFDRELVERVLEEHNLPKELARFMPEDRVSAIRDLTEEYLGLHPDSTTLVRQTTETILHLAELGHVILVGRAANVITARLPNVVHVRLVAPLDFRVSQVQRAHGLDPKAAKEFIEKTDEGRRRYARHYFQADLDDPLLYDLVINTARVTPDHAAALIAQAVQARVQQPERAAH